MPNDSIFEDDELQAEQTGAEQELVEAPDGKPQDGPVRDPETGRFLPKDGEEQPLDPNVNDEGGDAGGTVPQGALHAEREKRKAVQKELEAARQQLDAIAKMREQVASRKPADLPAADDPDGVEHLRTRLAEIDQRQTRFEQGMDAAALDQRETQHLASVTATSEAAYRAEHPDYDDAINHVVQARARELHLYGVPVADIQRIIVDEATEIARTAVTRGMDPAELGYKIAVERGYRPSQGGGNGAPAGQTNGSGTAAAKLDAIARAQGANKSLGAGGGGSGAALTAEAIAQMDGDEFEALYSTPEGRALIDGL